ncbi:YezD family protein [Altererythrobacter sp. CAU 1778]
MQSFKEPSSLTKVERPLDRWTEPLSAVADALSRVRFGAIQLTVHDGKVMQIDVTERRRFGD